MRSAIVIVKIFQSELLLLFNNDHCFCKFVPICNFSILENCRSRTAGFQSQRKEQGDDVSAKFDFRSQLKY